MQWRAVPGPRATMSYHSATTTCCSIPGNCRASSSSMIWCAIDSLLVLLTRWHWRPLPPLAWRLREVLFLPLWASLLFARTVIWCGRSVLAVGNRGS